MVTLWDTDPLSDADTELRRCSASLTLETLQTLGCIVMRFIDAYVYNAEEGSTHQNVMQNVLNHFQEVNFSADDQCTRYRHGEKRRGEGGTHTAALGALAPLDGRPAEARGLHGEAAIQPQVQGLVLHVMELTVDRLWLVKGQVDLQLQALPAAEVHLVCQPAVLVAGNAAR